MAERKADQKKEGSEVKAVPVPFALGEIKENININLNTANKPSKEKIINQRLQKGIEAHKEGKLQEAESIYRAILQSQPLNPNANHNLGVLAVSVNKADVALPLFKTALASNPKIEQFWLSYIEALIKGKQHEVAKQVIEQAKKQGVNEERLNALNMQLKETDTEEIQWKPSDTELNQLLLAYKNRQFDAAEKLAVSLSERFPNHPFSWKVLGALLKQTGRAIESLIPRQKSIQLTPKDATAHYDLGNTLIELGRLEEAQASYEQAIALKPDFVKAHFNLGITLKDMGRLEEAQASYKKATALKPDYAEAHFNLGATLRLLDRLEEAETSYKQAIALKNDFAKAYYGLGITFYIQGKIDLAIDYFRKATEIDSGFGGFIEFPEVNESGFKRFLTWDQELGWCPSPGLRKIDRNDTWNSGEGNSSYPYYSIDQYGARTGYANWDINSTRKIGLFGDSFCMSREVNDHETIGWHLGEITKFEVLNYGVGGYGIDQAFLRLKRVLSTDIGNKKYTDIVFIITPYTLARARSIYRHYLEPGNTFAVKPHLTMGSDGNHKLMPNPVKKKGELKSLDQFSEYFHRHDIHYRNRAWLITKKHEPYYSSFWRSDKEIFFSIIRALDKLRKINNLQISIVMTWGADFLKRHISSNPTPWVETFREAQNSCPDICFSDVMPDLLAKYSFDPSEIWLRQGKGHLTDKANYYIADNISKIIL